MGDWQRLETKIVYQNQWITVHEDHVVRPDGKPGIYGWIESSPGVFIVAVDEHHKVQLVRVKRYTTGRSSWELPAGGTDGQDVRAAAERELEEETGLHADRWEIAGEYDAWSGIATQRNTALIARGLHQSRQHKQAEEGIDAMKTATWAELKDMMAVGELTDSESITALTLAALKLGWIK